jgi:hypothetical protein
MHNLRELSEAIALGDTARAALVLDVMVRDEEFGEDDAEDARHAVDLGRTDATSKLRRAAAGCEPLKVAA